MISIIFRLFVLALIPISVGAQSLQLSSTSATSGNNSSTFELENGAVTISSENIAIQQSGVRGGNLAAAGFSTDLSKVGLLSRNQQDDRAILMNSRGDTLNAFSTISLSEDDPSFGIYPFNSGHLFIRDNITNFTFYDTFGEIETNMSSSSQTEEGEVISEVVLSVDGSTLVIYNPKISRNGQLGSQAQVRLSDNSFDNIYFSTNRYLKEVSVSNDGTVIIAVTARDGTSDEVLVMDRFGNELNSFTTDEDLIGAELSEDAGYITLYSGGRIQVFRTLSGERIGSTSIRSPLFKATYFPEESIILAVSGNYSENRDVLNSVEFHAVNIEQRSIARSEFNTSIGFDDRITSEFIRISPNRYRLVGSSRHVDITANF